MRNVSKYAHAALFLCVVPLFFISCQFGLEPSWKSDLPVVSVRLGPAPAANDRAIARGDGFLYIKTLGGPAESVARFYGPYKVAFGKEFTTQELPAGAYKGAILLHASSALNLTKSFTYAGKTITAKDVFSSDEIMGAILAASADKEAEPAISEEIQLIMDGLSDLFAGRVSFGAAGSFSLIAGQTTKLAQTLIPVISEDRTIRFPEDSSITASSVAVAKQFYRLEGVYSSNPSKGLVSITFAPNPEVADSSCSLGVAILYDSDGKMLGSVNPSSSAPEPVTSLKTIDFAVNADGSTFYLYVEYSGEMLIDMKVSDDLSGENASVYYSGFNDYEGAVILSGFWEASVLESWIAGLIISGEMPDDFQPPTDSLHFGIATVDSVGSASLTLFDASTGEYSPLIPSTEYYMMSFIDVDRDFAALTKEAVIALAGDYSSLGPDHGDLATSGDLLESETSSMIGLPLFKTDSNGVISLAPAQYTLYSSSTDVSMIAVSGVAGGAGKTVYVSAIEQTVFEAWLSDQTGDYTGQLPTETLSIGFMVLDSNGSAAVQLFDALTGSPAVIDPGKSYYVSAMVDMAGRFASMTLQDFIALKGDYSSFEPMIGDWSTDSEMNGMILKTPDSSGVIPVGLSDFMLSSSVRFEGNASLAGGRLVFGLLPYSEPMEGTMSHAGFMDLDANGNGSAMLYSFADNLFTPLLLAPNVQYAIGGFLDMDDDFSSITDISVLFSETTELDPDEGDYEFFKESMLTVTSDEQGRVWLSSEMLTLFVPSVEVSLTVTFDEAVDPVLTPVYVSLSQTNTLSITAPVGYVSYKWKLNGNLLTAQTTNVCSIVPGYYPDWIIAAAENTLMVEVDNGTEWLSAFIPFSLTN